MFRCRRIPSVGNSTSRRKGGRSRPCSESRQGDALSVSDSFVLAGIKDRVMITSALVRRQQQETDLKDPMPVFHSLRGYRLRMCWSGHPVHAFLTHKNDMGSSAPWQSLALEFDLHGLHWGKRNSELNGVERLEHSRSMPNEQRLLHITRVVEVGVEGHVVVSRADGIQYDSAE